MHEHKKNGLIQLNSPHIPVNKFLFGIKCLRFIPVCVLADGFCLFKYDYLYQTATNKFIEFRVLCSLHCAAVTTKTIPNSYKISTNSNTIDISDFWYRIKCNDSAIGLSSFMHEILLSFGWQRQLNHTLTHRKSRCHIQMYQNKLLTIYLRRFSPTLNDQLECANKLIGN